MITFISVLLIIMSLALVALVLAHRGQGGGLSSMFGGSFSANVSGSSVLQRNLDRLTLICGLIWLISIVGLSLLYKNQ